ncbi:MAG: SH3 domain-containing protein [Desulfobaccales bacterium]
MKPRLVIGLLLLGLILALVSACQEGGGYSGPPGPGPEAVMAPAPGPPNFFVSVDGLALRAGPGTGNPILTTLGFNQQVEMLSSNGSGWYQVRDLSTGTVGWAAARYLQSFPMSSPTPVPRKRPPAEGEQAPAPAPTPAPAPAPAPGQPKVM